jgi:hypothetical protein
LPPATPDDKVQEPADTEKEQAPEPPVTVRQGVRFVAYVGPMGGFRMLAIGNDEHFDPLMMGGELGGGLRVNFTRIISLQARVSLGYARGGEDVWMSWYTGKLSGWMGYVAADATLRIGFVGRAFPWYLGVGPSAGVDTVRAQGTLTRSAGGGAEPAAIEQSSSDTRPFMNGLVETGFVLGSSEQIDLGLRFRAGTAAGDVTMLWTANLGVAF